MKTWEGEADDDQRAADAEPAQVLAQPLRVARDRVADAIAKRAHREHQRCQQRDADERYHQPRQGRAAIRRRLPLPDALLA